MEIAKWGNVKTRMGPTDTDTKADIVIDATGSEKGISEAISLCRPRGTLVLKTTVAQESKLDLSTIVINELTLVRSRCGRFRDALQLLQHYPDIPLQRLITHTFPIAEAALAFERASDPEVLKILLDMP